MNDNFNPNNHISIAKQVIEKEAESLNILSQNIPKNFEILVEDILKHSKIGGKLIISGIGKSGNIAQKISASLVSTGTKSIFLHPSEASHGDLGIIDSKDIVIMLSNSGETKELFDIVSFCLKNKIKMALMTMNPESKIAQNCNYILNIPIVEEASDIKAPTSSSTMMIALGDALVVALHKYKGFTSKHFKEFHPGGKLGQIL